MLYFPALVAEKEKGRQLIITRAKNSQHLGPSAMGNKATEVLFTGQVS